ncbi:DUF4153 domain-containing protein [Massilia sp. IC2-278]|uniref:DUF4153 domain-containing protein n=1 Tax=Massilia sp. IC2-278 TaxID=2887200 RepID=UPI001E3F3162|nr:DUF4153 domain-containing protein [Massilia sp. IC2-278]MCC2961359.1 DUF4153 domain-containing protein [Massilia sp. IC2-278]
MHAAVQPGAAPASESSAMPRIALLRTGIGLVQGVILYLLYLVADYDVWPAIEPLLFAPVLLVALFAPILLISGLGHLTRRQVLAWVSTAAVLVAALAVYDIWRMGNMPERWNDSHVTMPSGELCVFLAASLFIAHALVLSGAHDRRRIAAYATYFEIAWKLGVQLAFSGLFVGIAWAALLLGSELFRLVKIDFLWKLIREPWFGIPVTAFAFSSAMHLTDVRPAIVQGIRGLLLVLASWILPVLTLIVAGFLASLPFTGLEPLWATRSAAAVLLCADAALVILINAAWQNGSAPVVRVIRLSARLAALLPVPLTAIAIYALALRVGEHGWTVDRIVAAACMLVASCYAIGYAAAALRKGWLALLARVNIATAFVVLGTVLLLFSPLLDPARVSVNSQLARLEAKKVGIDKFDLAYLRFDGQRFGQEALARLDGAAATSGDQALHERIAAVKKMRWRWAQEEDQVQTPAALASKVRVLPEGTRLPDSFLRTDWTAATGDIYLPRCLVTASARCTAYLLDVNGDGKDEVLVMDEAHPWSLVVQEDAEGRWHALATMSVVKCGRTEAGKADALPRTVAPALPDIDFGGGKRYQLSPAGSRDRDCSGP